MIEEYFQNIENIIASFDSIESFELKKKPLNNSFGIINGRLSYRNFKLEFIEVVRITDQGNPQKKKYKYHFQDDTNVLIFRYDNVPHHPQVNTFPHHKHTKAGILECKEPDLFNILLEVERIIRSS